MDARSAAIRDERRRDEGLPKQELEPRIATTRRLVTRSSPLHVKVALGITKTLFSSLSNHPTAASWAAILTRFAGQACLLAAVLTRFSKDEMTLWLTFNVVSTLQLVLDFGFSPTYVRFLSYATGAEGEFRNGQHSMFAGGGGQLLESVRKTYQRLFLCSLVLILLFGSWSLYGLINRMNATGQSIAWLAWIIAGIAYGLGIFQNRFIVVLQGVGHLGRQRTIEAALSAATTIVNVFAIFAGGGILGFASITLAATVVGSIVYGHACKQLVSGSMQRSREEVAIDGLGRLVWQSAWRSGVGVASLFGINQTAQLVLIKFTEGANLASYLLGIQIMQALNILCQPPFYSKTPHFAQLYAKNRTAEIVHDAQDAMRMSYWILVSGALTIGWIAPWLLNLIQSNTLFPSPLFWHLLTIAIFLERFGAMHLQLYTVTNHVVWHVVSLISGAILILLMAIFLPAFGPIGYPLAMLLAYLSFYSWYPARLSYRRFAEHPWRFEKRSALYPGIVLLGALLISVLTN